tara:strand:- start:276 stop:695 length:420 start_codon:yes stop_codon:yes gene_type:complete
MIKQITKNILENNKLEVIIETTVRNFIKEPVKILTDNQVQEILSEEFSILKTIQSPSHPVGNSIRRGVKQKGTWVFEIEIAVPNKEILEEKPTIEKTEENKPPAPKARTQNRKRKPATKKSSTPSSIRGRMTKIVKKEE